MRKILLVLLTLTTVLFIFSGCSKNEAPDKAESAGSTAQSAAVEDVEKSGNEETMEISKYYIDEDILSAIGPVDGEMYQAVYDAIDQIASEYDLSSFSPTDEDVETLMKAVGDRVNYELFYFFNWDYDSSSKKLAFTYHYEKEKIQEKRKELNEKVRFIQENVLDKDATQLQNEMNLYWYIAATTDYDTETFKTGEGDVNMYEVLMNHKGMCRSYAATMKYFLDRLGVETHLVSSSGHAWNIVKIDGEYYHVDVTSATPLNPEKFNFTDNDLKNIYSFGKDDIWVGNKNYKKLDAPACDSDRFNWLRSYSTYALDGNDLYISDPYNDYETYVTEFDDHTENMRKISGFKPYIMVVYGDYIYFSDISRDLNLCRIKKEGSEVEVLDGNISAQKMWREGDKLIYGSSFASLREYTLK